MPRGELWAIRNSDRNVWTPAQQQAGLAFTLHDLRHTFASRPLAAGIPLIEVFAWMGHGLHAGGHKITNTTTARSCARDGRMAQAALAALVAGVDAEFGGARRESVCSTHPPAAARKKVTAK